MPNRARTWIVGAVATVAISAAALSIPECPAPPPDGPQAQAFAWDRDDLWQALERRFLEARAHGCDASGVDAAAADLASHVANLEDAAFDDPRWDDVENRFFALAVSAGVCPDLVDRLITSRRLLRITAKDAARTWSGRAARDRLYRILYGTRAGVEEVLLQLGSGAAPTLSEGRSVESQAPSVEIHGVRVHSGDLLVSRGGAPTSAFIARGNDFPGNFSHVALVHVDAETEEVSIVESHIEVGVVVSDLETYLADKKLRIMVLRLRPGHDALRADPLLAHKAADAALAATQAAHIPYDFAMDFTDSSEQFCSEVASSAYRGLGVILWPELSTFSSRGLARWMAGFGVRHLETQSPSDLELDPQLVVVAEWHDPSTLWHDHIDNAVIDAMLEQAEAGAVLDYSRRMLPIVRLLKGYSVVLNVLGGVGPIPEGMSAATALRVASLRERHGKLRTRVVAAAEAFAAEQGYVAPYWELLRMAREAI